MAKKKKKKNTKTLKALGIFILIISAVCLGISIGNGTLLKTDDNDTNQTIANNNNSNSNSYKEKDNNTDKVQEPEKPEEKTKPQEQDKETTEPEDTQNNQDEEKQEHSEEQVSEGSDIGDNLDIDIDTSTLSNTAYSWSFKRNKDHVKPLAYNKIDIQQYAGYYVINTDEKVIYLTFDAGYENGYTPSILDTLKDNDVQAAFFVTKPYIVNNVELAKRMKEEGHIVANHSVNHEEMHTLSDEVAIYEIEETARYYEEATGYKMDNFFRPPKGEYSERTLYITKKLGYRTIFWSMAYGDWDRNDQPGKEAAYKHLMDNYHPGMISLLHAVSSSNAEALDDIIKSLKEKGYRFGNLYEVE
jgi:peptidoglycan-N-acetylmuramic acid deacetylase